MPTGYLNRTTATSDASPTYRFGRPWIFRIVPPTLPSPSRSNPATDSSSGSVSMDGTFTSGETAIASSRMARLIRYAMSLDRNRSGSRIITSSVLPAAGKNVPGKGL